MLSPIVVFTVLVFRPLSLVLLCFTVAVTSSFLFTRAAHLPTVGPTLLSRILVLTRAGSVPRLPMLSVLVVSVPRVSIALAT